MKTLHDNAFKCAIALFAAAGFAACSSSDDVADESPVNPSYDGKSVKTQFVINIGSVGKGTRMSADDTQQGGDKFNGMSSIYLLPLNAVPEATTNFTSNVGLTDIAAELSSLDDSHRKIYENVSIPVGTSNFLLYAKGPSGDYGTADAFSKGAIGAFNISTSSKPEDIEFKAVKIANGNFSTELASRVVFLNAIKSVEGWSTTEDPTLSQAYTAFTQNAKNRAVSSSALTKWMQDLYDVAKTKEGDATVGTIATAIMNAIVSTESGYFTADAAGKLTIATGKADFPSTIFLPDGVAVVQYASGSFATVNAIGGASNLDVASIIYPLPITYRCNTLAKATDADITIWPSSTSLWANYDWANNGWYGDVKVTSRTIALDNPINYGVALLETTVSCSSPTLQDGDAANTVYVNVPAGGFPVTGLLVGGQPESVDWNYLSEKAVSAHTQTVYDKSVTTGMTAAYGASTPASNYTLLFDSYTSDENQAKIRVAIELKNNSGQEFTGVDGVIAAGEKFYLIAELDPASTSAGSISWNDVADDLRFPKKGVTRVFIQDFKTKAAFNIKSLKNAYVTIPDLRSTTLKLGLSVDLTWQTGLTFNVDIE